jgi:protein-S-isoprenylcysteine O-methyltransferase Ste14
MARTATSPDTSKWMLGKAGDAALMRKKIRLALFGICLIIPTFIEVFSASRWHRMGIVGSLFFLLGSVLAGLASLGRLWCSLYIAGYKNEELIEDGPYSLCRNPMYFCNLLGFLGIGLGSESLITTGFLMLAYAIHYPFRIRSEEEKLRRKFEAFYDAYRRTTPALFPRLSSWQEPETYVVKPKKFRMHILYDLWFIWFLGILHLVESLHDLGILPTLLRVY